MLQRVRELVERGVVIPVPRSVEVDDAVQPDRMRQ